MKTSGRATSDYLHLYLVLDGSKEHEEIRHKLWDAMSRLINRSPYDKIISSMERPTEAHPDGRYEFPEPEPPTPAQQAEAAMSRQRGSSEP